MSSPLPTLAVDRICDEPEPYRMHSSQRYLDLTRKKIELTRTPRELSGEAQDHTRSARNATIDPLLNFWLQKYNLREEENRYNDLLPQFRLNIDLTKQETANDDENSLRIHFVHRKSNQSGALPLLICHDWGSSFLEVARIVEPLCEPVTTPTPDCHNPQAFHIICPSIPGFGFSDASGRANFGILDTADIFHALMLRLGYKQFVVYGSGWGFNICREIAHRHAESCIGIYTVNPIMPHPTLLQHPMAYAKQCLARWSKTGIPWLSFGYVPSDFTANVVCETPPGTTTLGFDDSETLKYGLTDSPTCLLASMLGLIRPYRPSRENGFELPTNSIADHLFAHQWSASDVLTWTMVYWLSGTEAPLRWLRQARQETARDSCHWRFESKVPLGISHFGPSSAAGIGRQLCPPMWASAYHTLKWLRRHHHRPDVNYPAWETFDQVVLDLRCFVQEIGSDRRPE